ncbi:MAG: YggT family protein [Anaerolineae bacterium]|jgi:YggT family protein|nr:YggT family protein [Anaerolineae bacterium]
MIIIQLIVFLLWIYQLIMLARVFMSWFPNLDRYNPVVQFIYQVTEPVLRPIRELLPPTMGIDFSPLIVFIGISILMMILR